MKNDDIRRPEILTKIGKLASAGLSWTYIADMLKKEDGIDAAPQLVHKVYEEFTHRTTAIIAGDQKLKDLIKADILGIVDQMKAINSTAWDILAELQQSKVRQPGTMLKALKEIRGQLELNMRLSERLTSSVNLDKVNKVELTQNIVNIFEKLKKDGYGEIEICPVCGFKRAPDPMNVVKSLIDTQHVNMEVSNMAQDEYEDEDYVEENEESEDEE